MLSCRGDSKCWFEQKATPPLQFETMVEKYQEDFERVSANLKQESQRLDRLRKSEFKETLISSLESALANQQRVCYYKLF